MNETDNQYLDEQEYGDEEETDKVNALVITTLFFVFKHSELRMGLWTEL